MAKITVNPATFELVEFDNAEIVAVVADLCDRLGVDSATEITIDVDEVEMVARVTDVTASGNTIAVQLTGGALEDKHRARQFSADRAGTVLGMVLLRAADRLGPMASAPADGELDVKSWTAWEVNAEGRLGRAGFPVRKSRRLYTFRLRHGFSDAIDEIFERLWNADDLTWDEIVAACAETADLDPGPLPTIKA